MAALLTSLGALTLAGGYGFVLLLAGLVLAVVLFRRQVAGAAWFVVPVTATAIGLIIGYFVF